MTMARENPLFLKESTFALATDLYELTMAAGYFRAGLDEPASFELFVRDMPPHRSYLLVAGLEQAVHYLRRLRFPGKTIDYLRQQEVFAHVEPEFFEYLREFRFGGDVDAMPEGTVAFADEPLLQVTAPLIQAQIVETYLLATVNFQTLVATKASRVVAAAQGRPVVDFGTRRAHGPQAGLAAARAAYIGGCAGTSNVLAGYEMGIPIFGTQAHSWVMSFDSEAQAFQAYFDVFPEHTTLLLDTYDTLEAARKATVFGPSLSGVRLDSGKLASLSRRTRRILDEAGMTDTRILASGDLNEYRIESLLKQDAQIDGFGVGTDLVTSRDAPALGGVYKLVEQQRGGRDVPRLKASSGKGTYPGKKQVRRLADRRGRYRRDVVCLAAEEDCEGRALLIPILRDGRRVQPLPALDAIRGRAARDLQLLPPRCRRLHDPEAYPVEASNALRKLRDEIIEQIEGDSHQGGDA
ncbi:MAG: nicotinate phosphoribosyltransferase [Planctomycetota bacterium]